METGIEQGMQETEDRYIKAWRCSLRRLSGKELEGLIKDDAITLWLRRRLQNPVDEENAGRS
jgi:hypothetical protein